ncbi:fimbria/pilus periplasmic chaperone [Pseudomonas sp. NPDC078700]|uniref:fimbria/pilus periplasmic chaperone n=1 Tax=Pseudomonas sp. NPDC078700 TaxID=3364424 RepID=UPI0037C61AC3
MQGVLKNLGRCLLVGVLLVPILANAAVQITGTRIIYPAAEREVVVRLTNASDRPALVQAWLDSGDASVQPGVEQLPFVVLPPLVRVEARKGQALRIAHVGGELAQDRESVFWLNVLDVPPKADTSAGQNVVQLAFRTRLKLFYRPEGLPGNPTASVEDLHWSVVPNGKGFALRVRNDSAYHVSFNEIGLKAGSKTYNVDAGGMVAPRSSEDFLLVGLNAPPSAGEVEAKWLDDFGASREQRYTLQPK